MGGGQCSWKGRWCPSSHPSIYPSTNHTISTMYLSDSLLFPWRLSWIDLSSSNSLSTTQTLPIQLRRRTADSHFIQNYKFKEIAENKCLNTNYCSYKLKSKFAIKEIFPSFILYSLCFLRLPFLMILHKTKARAQYNWNAPCCSSSAWNSYISILHWPPVDNKIRTSELIKVEINH